jgi:hypothetical protein
MRESLGPRINNVVPGSTQHMLHPSQTHVLGPRLEYALKTLPGQVRS